MARTTKRWEAAALGAAAFIIVASGVYFLSPAENSPSKGPLKSNDANVVATGQRIYAQSCASCHGDRLEGEEEWQTRDDAGYLPAPPHDETGHTWHHADQLLFDLTKFGVQKYAGDDYKTKMPAYEELLNDDEIIAVLSYIKSQWPEKIRTRHDQLNAEKN